MRLDLVPSLAQSFQRAALELGERQYAAYGFRLVLVSTLAQSCQRAAVDVKATRVLH